MSQNDVLLVFKTLGIKISKGTFIELRNAKVFPTPKFYKNSFHYTKNQVYKMCISMCLLMNLPISVSQEIEKAITIVLNRPKYEAQRNKT